MDGGKFGDTNHVKDLFKMVGDACDDNALVVSFYSGQELNQQRNATAVDIRFFVTFQYDIAGALFLGFPVGLIQEGAGKSCDIALDVDDGDVAFLFKIYFIFFLHLHPVLPNTLIIVAFSNVHGKAFLPAGAVRSNAIFFDDDIQTVTGFGVMVEFDFIRKFPD